MSTKIIGIGNAIVDVLCKVDDEFLVANSLTKGSMSLIDEKTAQKLLKLKPEKITSGGSAGNTIATLAQLKIACDFIGKVSADELGKKYIEEISKTSVNFVNKNYSKNSTAKSFILITPDANRTMCTFLGCASEISENDIKEDSFKNADFLYLEGYLWDSEATISALKKAIKLAKQNNVKIAFSLSDLFCVLRHKNDFLNLIKNDLDLLFANESEAIELIDSGKFSADKLNEFFSSNPKLVAAITRSENGCVIFSNKKYFEVSAKKVINLVDTTGAGDAFAAGFLYGLCNNYSLKNSAEYGNKLAAEIIQKFGARFENNEL